MTREKDEFRGWLEKYIRQHLGRWARETDREIMKPPAIKNWPTKIEVDLPCECCGKTVKVPFVAKRFRAKSHANWPYYIEYMSPALLNSTCPECKRPFRLRLPMPTRAQ